MDRLRNAASPRHEGAERRDGGWAAAVRAERRMQAAQLAIVVVLGLVVFAVAAITGRGMVAELGRYRSDQDIQSSLDSLRYALQEEEAGLWRRRASGETNIPLEVDGMRAVVDLVITSPGAPAPGSAADRRFLSRLAPLISELKASADAWAGENAGELEASNAAVASATRRIVTLTGATALIALLLGLLTWRLVARSRRRLAAALQAATERLRHQADTDPLTGLSNQRLLHDRLQEATAQARSRRSGLSAIMIDLDHFKTVNDTFGHPVGDLVLVETARRICESARTGDLVARIGGEEFLMLLPDTDGVTALAVAERVRASVRATDYEGDVGRLTASLGVATLTEGLDADALLAQADAALYWAKRHGRDAAFIYDVGPMGDSSPNAMSGAQIPEGARILATTRPAEITAG